MKLARRKFLRSFALAAGGLWLPAARAQRFGGFTIPHLAGPSAVTTDAVWSGLNAYWKLDEATGALRADVSGNGNNLTDTGANIAGAAGMFGGCANCLSAGGTPCLQIADNASLGAGSGVSFSVAMWIKSAGSANAGVIGKWGSTTDWSLNCNGSNNLQFSAHPIGLGQSNSIFNANLNNTWQHYVITFNAATGTFTGYNNGAQTVSAVLGANIQRSACSFALFNYGDIHAASTPGLMDDTAYWGRVLSAAEVTHLWNGGAGMVFKT